LDISDSGIRLRSSIELAPGTLVFLQSKDTSGSGYCIVRHCTNRNEAFEIGLEFHEETRASMTVSGAQDLDFYEFLQVNPRAEMATIHRIYRFLAGRFHPDNPETGDPEKFLHLNRAYGVLSHPERRADYDAKRQDLDVRQNPIFEKSEFVNGIEGEMNRRLGVLSLLYSKRRTSPEFPQVSLSELEKHMGWPREYLDFTTWYLRSTHYITREDNSDFALTALGVDFVESNYTKMPLLNKLLNSGARTATSVTSPVHHKHSGTCGELLLMSPIPSQETGQLQGLQ